MRKLLSFLERNPSISWCITIVIGIFIYYISSMQFKVGAGGSANINSLIYHLLIFFVFSLFLSISIVRGKDIRYVSFALIISVIYGYLDEVHQIFVPGRSYAYFDMLLDFVGSILAISTYVIMKSSLRK